MYLDFVLFCCTMFQQDLLVLSDYRDVIMLTVADQDIKPHSQETGAKKPQPITCANFGFIFILNFIFGIE